MDDEYATVARRCLDGAERDAMTFPEIVETLARTGFDGYAVDFRRGAVTYYPAAGGVVDLEIHGHEPSVAQAFDAGAVGEAVLEAQRLVPGFTYRGFCRKVMDAGCAGYMVSLPGRRVVYYGVTGDQHTEHFPS